MGEELLGGTTARWTMVLALLVGSGATGRYDGCAAGWERWTMVVALLGGTMAALRWTTVDALLVGRARWDRAALLVGRGCLLGGTKAALLGGRRGRHLSRCSWER